MTELQIGVTAYKRHEMHRLLIRVVLRGELLDHLGDGEAGFAHRFSLGCDGPARYPSRRDPGPGGCFFKRDRQRGVAFDLVHSSQPELQSTRQGSR